MNNWLSIDSNRTLSFHPFQLNLVLKSFGCICWIQENWSGTRDFMKINIAMTPQCLCSQNFFLVAFPEITRHMLGHFYFLLYRVSKILLFTALTVVGSGRTEPKNEAGWSDAIATFIQSIRQFIPWELRRVTSVICTDHEDRLHMHVLL